MLIDDVYDGSVGFLFSMCQPNGEFVPAATVFYVQHGGIDYAVTCAHCIISNPVKERLFLQIDANGYVEAPELQWVKHSSTDVAVFRLHESHNLKPLPVRVLLENENHLHVGHELFLMGLFQPQSREAIARFGRLSKPRTQCGIAIGKYKIQTPCHLAETMAWAGQSGSPVFLNDATISTDRDDCFYGPLPAGYGFGIPPRVFQARHTRPPLIGLLHGPFPISTKIVEDEERKANSGVSAIIPARYIRETLDLA